MYYENSYKQWSNEDENKLIEHYNLGITLEQIGLLLKRSKISIRSKLKRMNLLKTKKIKKKLIKYWSEQEIRQLVKLYGSKKFTVKEMAIICGKSIQAIIYKLSQMKLNMPKKYIALRSYSNWSDYEIDKLVKLKYVYNYSTDEIGIILSRTKNAIEMKLKKLF